MKPARLLCPWDFLRQEYWSGLPFPPPGNLPHPEFEPTSHVSPALQADSLGNTAVTTILQHCYPEHSIKLSPQGQFLLPRVCQGQPPSHAPGDWSFHNCPFSICTSILSWPIHEVHICFSFSGYWEHSRSFPFPTLAIQRSQEKVSTQNRQMTQGLGHRFVYLFIFCFLSNLLVLNPEFSMVYDIWCISPTLWHFHLLTSISTWRPIPVSPCESLVTCWGAVWEWWRVLCCRRHELDLQS